MNSIQRDNNIVDKLYLYAKDLDEPRYKLLINKTEKAGINFNNDPTAFIEYSNSMDDVLSNIEDYNKERKRKTLIIFDDMIFHVMSDKKVHQILKDIFIRCRLLNIPLFFFNTIIFHCSKRCKIKLYSLYFI